MHQQALSNSDGLSSKFAQNLTGINRRAFAVAHGQATIYQDMGHARGVAARVACGGVAGDAGFVKDADVGVISCL